MKVTPLGLFLLDVEPPERNTEAKRVKGNIEHSHEPWLPEDDRKLLALIRDHRLPIHRDIPSSLINEWARDYGRTRGAIRSRIKKYDDHEKSHHPFEKEEKNTIWSALNQGMKNRELHQFLSDRLLRSPQVIAVMIDDAVNSIDER